MPDSKQRQRTPRERKQASALEFRHLRAFVALVDHGSITAAAQALGLAQSTVSESLAALDRALGTRATLRRRGAQDVLLTAVGHTLLPHARKMLDSLDSAYMEVAEVANDAQATLEIVTNESVSTYLLPEVLATLRAQWVNTRFSVSVSSCTGVRAGINDEEFDIGLLLEVDELVTQPDAPLPRPPASAVTANLSSDGTVIVVGKVPLVVFAGETHALAGRRTAVRREEISEYPLFMSDAAGDFHALIRRFFFSDGMPGPHLEAAGSVEGVKRGVMADSRALGILPEYAITEELQAGQFLALSLRTSPPRMRLAALFPERRARHPAVDELLNGVSLELKQAERSRSSRR